ncbi:MAG: hypothetical protein INR71_12185 [Terriglobus roseus]|nr:hypothetical protein [Terriglobus roseus]
MTWTSHSSVGVAQAIFYVPILLLSFHLLFFRQGPPFFAWRSMLLFSAVRIAGGIVLILVQNNPDSVGLIIAGLILENTGVIPLLLVADGLLTIMCVSERPRWSSRGIADASQARMWTCVTRAAMGTGWV